MPEICLRLVCCWPFIVWNQSTSSQRHPRKYSQQRCSRVEIVSRDAKRLSLNLNRTRPVVPGVDPGQHFSGTPATNTKHIVIAFPKPGMSPALSVRATQKAGSSGLNVASQVASIVKLDKSSIQPSHCCCCSHHVLPVSRAGVDSDGLFLSPVLPSLTAGTAYTRASSGWWSV